MDLISRKAVIDGIEELKKSPWANDNRNGYEYLIPEALETVRDLCVKDCPSAFEGKTNGEVIISLYPNLKYTIRNGRVVTTIGVASSFDLDWWNAPYKGVSE